MPHLLYLIHCTVIVFTSHHIRRISSVQFSSVTQSCPNLCDSMNARPPVHHQLPEFTQTHAIKSGMPSSHLILCCPLFLLPPIPPSIMVFSHESTLRMRWPKYWSFSFSISPSNEHPGLITFRMDWLDLLAVQATLNSLLQTMVQKHQFFEAQLSSQSNSHIHTWTLEKPLPWLDGPLLANLMSLLLNMLSRLVITFLPRSKGLLISWLQSPSAVMLEPKKIKVQHCFHCFLIYFPWSDGTRCHDLSFLNAEP